MPLIHLPPLSRTPCFTNDSMCRGRMLTIASSETTRLPLPLTLVTVLFRLLGHLDLLSVYRTHTFGSALRHPWSLFHPVSSHSTKSTHQLTHTPLSISSARSWMEISGNQKSSPTHYRKLQTGIDLGLNINKTSNNTTSHINSFPSSSFSPRLPITWSRSSTS